MAVWQAILELADDHLVLGHRISEWCGHAPMLEEDLALPNMALDLIGSARVLYDHAGNLEGAGRSEDDLAYLRGEREYRNCLLVERPNEDFAHTMLRSLYFAAFMRPFWLKTLEMSGDETLRGVAGKAEKEMAYHIRHAGEWVIRLGDGTDESAARMREAVASLHIYVDELFESSAVAVEAKASEVLPVRGDLRAAFDATLTPIFAEALLEVPQVPYPQTGGRVGVHGEGLGHLLAEMQSVHRAHPGARW